VCTCSIAPAGGFAGHSNRRSRSAPPTLIGSRPALPRPFFGTIFGPEPEHVGVGSIRRPRWPASSAWDRGLSSPIRLTIEPQSAGPDGMDAVLQGYVNRVVGKAPIARAAAGSPAAGPLRLGTFTDPAAGGLDAACCATERPRTPRAGPTLEPHRCGRTPSFPSSGTATCCGSCSRLVSRDGPLYSFRLSSPDPTKDQRHQGAARAVFPVHAGLSDQPGLHLPIGSLVPLFGLKSSPVGCSS
jgi:hypothetical protein